MASEQDLIHLNHSPGNTVTVHLYGATLISWIQNEEEVIFVSSKSHFDNKKAIRGGIPIVFPNFGPWDLGPQHGFARICRWNVEKSPCKNADGDTEAVFTLTDNDDTRKMWNFKFKLTFTVALSNQTLKTSLKVENTDSKQFDFTCLLHTYLHVPDVTMVTVSGLQGLTYTDKVKGGATETETRELVRVAENVDRVYGSTPSEHQVSNTIGGKTVVIKKSGLPDTVVWNPWEKAAGMSDFGDDEYPKMICVEAGHVVNRQVLNAGGHFEGTQTLTRN